MKPKVSLLMTIFNAAPYLSRSIDSLLTQEFADWDLIAVENGSSDESAAILAGYTDPRIRVLSQTRNLGRTPALRLAFDAAEGEYIAVLDADDVSHPQRLLRQVEHLDAHPEVVLVGTWAHYIDADDTVIGEWTPPADAQALRALFASENPIVHSSAMYRATAARAVGGYPLSAAFGQDLALWLNLLEVGEPHVLASHLSSFRILPQSMTRGGKYRVEAARDKMLLLVRAGARPPTPAARRRNREELAIARFRYAVALGASGRWLRMAGATGAAVLRDPYHLLNNRITRELLGGRAAPAPVVQQRPLLVGPLPPPVGGIATMVATLFDDPGARASIALLDTRKRDAGHLLSGRLHSLGLLVDLHRGLLERPPRVLVFSSANASFWEKACWLLLARLHRVPMMAMMVDGNFEDFHRRSPRVVQVLMRRILERFDLVITQTESWRRFYRRIAPDARLTVMSNGVDALQFPYGVRPPRPIPVVLFVGWLIPAKGIFDLIEAARILHAEGISFSLVLLGPEHGYASQLQQRLQEAGLQGVVRLHGEVRVREELLAAYREADVFALPSWAEGLPNALMEAMATGLPAVATSVGGIPDLIEDGVSGCLVPAKNPALLAAALRSLLVDPALRIRMGERAASRIARCFPQQAFIDALRELLESGARRADRPEVGC